MRSDAAAAVLDVLALALLAAPAFAQVFTGRIDAEIRDASGAAVPGVNVELSGRRTAPPPRRAWPGTLPEPAGRHLQGDGGAHRLRHLHGSSVSVSAGTAVPLRIAMKVSARSEEVEVTAEAPLIDNKKQSTGVSISKEELAEIPTSRDPLSIVQNVPSVVTDRINVGGSSRAAAPTTSPRARPNQDNTVNLDGVSLQDGGYEYALGRVDFDSFQEVQVTTGGATTTNPSPGSRSTTS